MVNSVIEKSEIVNIWKAKHNLENSLPLNETDRKTLLSVLKKVTEREVPSEREYKNYIEAKDKIEGGNINEESDSYLYFSKIVSSFENKYYNFTREA